MKLFKIHNYLWLIVALIMVVAGRSMAEDIMVELSFKEGDLSYRTLNGMEIVNLKEGKLSGNKPGTPRLPARFINVLVPSGAQVTDVKVVAEEAMVRQNVSLYPVQPPCSPSLPRPAFVPADPVAYASGEKTPAALAEQGQTHTMSGYTFVSVRLNPVRYIPAKKELYLAGKMTVTVTLGAVRKALPAPVRNNEIFDRMVKAMVVNPGQAGANPSVLKGVQTLGLCDYLIITNDALVASFQNLATQRRINNGFTTEVKTVASIYSGYAGKDNQEKIRNCIRDYKLNRSTLYVVLGGDDTVVPVRGCYVLCRDDNEGDIIEPAMPTDLYYSGLDGSWDGDGDGVYGEAGAGEDGDSVDLAPDVIVGRIPVQDATQANAYINKLIGFENSPPSQAFYRKMMVMGAMAWNTYSGTSRPSDVCNDGHSEFQAHSPVSDTEIWVRRAYRDKIRPFWEATTEFAVFTDTMTHWDGAGAAGNYLMNSTNMVTRFNEGWHFAYMYTHGDTTLWGAEGEETFDIANAASLTNNTPFIYTAACNTGGFDVGEPSLSEAFLRNPNGGALAYMGCNRYGWGDPETIYGGPSPDYANEFYNQMFAQKRTILGEAFAMHKAAFIAASATNDAERWIQFGLNLQGDPAMRIVLGDSVPQILTNTTALPVPEGDTNTFNVKLSSVPASDVMVTVVRITGDTDISVSSGASLTFTTANWNTYQTVTLAAAEDSDALNSSATIRCSGIGNPIDVIATEEDNDRPTVTLTVTDANASETGPDVGTFTITRTGSTATALNLRIIMGGSATNGTDYVAISSPVTIPAGSASLIVNVTPIDDTVPEFTETVVVSLLKGIPDEYNIGYPNGGTISIIDNELPMITVSATDPDADETDWIFDTGKFTILRTGNPAAALTVNFTLTGTATNGADYHNLATSTTFDTGAMSKNIVITPIDDTIPEFTETVILTITNGAGYIVGTSLNTMVWILDNDRTEEMRILTPNGGETWIANTCAKVTWTTARVVGNVDIEITIAADTPGGAWTTLVSNTPNDGTQVVAVPNTPSAYCQVCVSASSSGDPSAYSDANFTIEVSGSTPPTITDVTISKARIKLNFRKPNSDMLVLSGAVPIPLGFTPKDKSVVIAIGDYESTFTLNEKRKVVSGNDSLKLAGKLRRGVYISGPMKFIYTVKKQNLFDKLKNYGFVNDDVVRPGNSIDLPVRITVDGDSYLNTLTVTYTAKKDKNGSARTMNREQ
ncbi:MAG: C25 family cysteine peptidase [Planctomycetota bacterium]